MRSNRNKAKHGKTENSSIKTNAAKAVSFFSKKDDNKTDNIKKSNKKNNSEFKISKDYILLGAAAVFFCITAALSINYAVNSTANASIDTAYEALDSELIYNGIYLEEVSIGGLTKEQAIAKGTSDYAGRRLSKSFTLSYDNYKKVVTYEDLGAAYDIKGAVNDAYKLGRTGTKASRISYTKNIEDRNEFLTPEFTIDKSKLKSLLNDVADEINGTVILNGEMDVDRMADRLEDSMLVSDSDTIFEISTK